MKNLKENVEHIDIKKVMDLLQVEIKVENRETVIYVAGKKIEEEPSLQPLLDQAVMRILKLKNEMGLFEDPGRGTDPEKARKLWLCKEHRQVAKEAALESMVLLKNEGITFFISSSVFFHFFHFLHLSSTTLHRSS